MLRGNGSACLPEMVQVWGVAAQTQGGLGKGAGEEERQVDPQGQAERRDWRWRLRDAEESTAGREDEEREMERQTRWTGSPPPPHCGGEWRGRLREAGGGAQMGAEEGVCEQSQTQGEEGKGAREEQERTR